MHEQFVPKTMWNNSGGRWNLEKALTSLVKH